MVAIAPKLITIAYAIPEPLHQGSFSAAEPGS